VEETGITRASDAVSRFNVGDVDYPSGYPPFSRRLTTSRWFVNLLHINKIKDYLGDIHTLHSPYYYYLFSFLIYILLQEGTERPEGTFHPELTRSGETDESQTFAG
jgi:hypothetical protein